MSKPAVSAETLLRIIRKSAAFHDSVVQHAVSATDWKYSKSEHARYLGFLRNALRTGAEAMNGAAQQIQDEEQGK
jgi:hypothetical protein